jgi:hypothetical protein
MFADGMTEYVRRAEKIEPTGDPLTDLRTAIHFFVRFCAEDVPRYQLLFQRTIPGFEPSPESYGISVAALQLVGQRLRAVGVVTPELLDLYTALSTGLADQQISNDPGGDRWIRLIDDAAEMFVNHITRNHTTKKGGRNK